MYKPPAFRERNFSLVGHFTNNDQPPVMTRYKKEIRLMYREIIQYRGEFGDPISTPAFTPWELIRDSSLTDFERRGVCVAILCYLATAIDNSTYDDAVDSNVARQVRLILLDDRLEILPLGTLTLKAFFISEAAFQSALDDVYRDWVIPGAGTP